MRRPDILGIQALNTESLVQQWWEWALVGIISSSGLIGAIAFLWYVYRSIHNFVKSSEDEKPLPRSVQERIHLLSSSSHAVCKRHPPPKKPQSFGVYLGNLSSPVTMEETQILSQWDTVVLDYCKPGVLEAVSDGIVSLGPHIIARLDLLQIMNFVAMDNEVDMSRAAETLSWTIQQTLRQSGKRRYFTGVLIAGWRERVSTPLLNGLAEILTAYGLENYLEIGPPDYLDGIERLEFHHFTGFIVRNGTILTSGERRDFFNMEKMKTTTRAFVSQACQRPFFTMMWDTVANEVDLSHAVVRRAHMWCNYHGAVPFFTRDCALTNIEEICAYEEPLSAFQWLKLRSVMNVHEMYRTARTLSSNLSTSIHDLSPLQDIFPLIGNALASLDSAKPRDQDNLLPSRYTIATEYSQINENGFSVPEMSDVSGTSFQDWSSAQETRKSNPLSCAFDGTTYKALGCFPIGLNASKSDFDHVLKSQRKLRDLKLLSKISAEELHMASDVLRGYSVQANDYFDSIPALREAILCLSTLLAETTDDSEDICQLQIYSGLDSGFRTPAGRKFWSVWELESHSTSVVIYVSKSVQDLTSVLLHTQLSRLGFSRYQCFLAEKGLSEYDNKSRTSQVLPCRLQNDLTLLSTSEILLYLQHLKFTEWDRECSLLSAIRKECEVLIIEVPTYKQLKRLSNMDFISGTISEEELVTAKLEWYRLCGLPTLNQHAALELFMHISRIFYDILWHLDHEKMDKLTCAAETLARKGSLDSMADFVLFALFCTARKAAFEEVYIEVSDRNPLFNQYSDQSAAFAELFALGSRCEAYFDIKPSDIGLLLSKKHRDHYSQEEHQPPMWLFNAPSFASAYAAAQTDVDPQQKASVMPAYRRFTYLSVFAIPALVDIILLSTIGRGLYLSTRMSEAELKYATMALMCSLLLSGAIGTWISIGGTYYLISMAFSAANMFVLTRLIGGLALTLAACLLGFVVVSAAVGPGQGAVFFFYLLGLTAYLSVLAVLSTYQIPGSSFLNGRKVIIIVVPTLIISPVLTMFIPGRDIYIYLGVLYVFVLLLLMGTRRVATQWVTWYHNIKTLNDSDVKGWYVGRQEEKRRAMPMGASKAVLPSESPTPDVARDTESPEIGGKASSGLQGLSEPAILGICRKELYDAVMKEKTRRFWHKRTSDTLVKHLSDCWDSTLFLLDWYCRVTDTKRPIPYSSTWNLETQVALESMQQSQKGIRLHNSFIHWRTAGDEVYCGILYFIVALMDRWLDLIHGSRMVGLGGDSTNNTLRLSVGFGLAYYLIGAVLLDYKAQHLHTLSEQMSPISIENLAQIKKAKSNDQKFRRHLYFGTLCRFIAVHVWALALCASMIWVFNGSSTGLIMFLAYVGAYSGLLLYQYNKIFSGPHAMMPLLIAVVFGITVGCILMQITANFPYDKVIALAVSTWTAALLSFRTAKLGFPDTLDFRGWISTHLPQILKTFCSVKFKTIVKTPSQLKIHRKLDEKFHAYSSCGSDQKFSQSELQAVCDKIRAAAKEDRYCIFHAGETGGHISAILSTCTHETLSGLALQAYPTIPRLIQAILLAWKNAMISVMIVPMQGIAEIGMDIRAISHYEDGHLNLYIASDMDSLNNGQPDINSNTRMIAETLLHACMKTLFGLPPQQAAITESILASHKVNTGMYTISECARRSMPTTSSGSCAISFESNCREELLRNLCLGLDCDHQWDSLPLYMRRFMLRRCLGERGAYTNTELSWINENVPAEDSCTLLMRIARYDLGAYLAVNKLSCFLGLRDQYPTMKEYRQITADVREAHHLLVNHSPVSIMSMTMKHFRVSAAYVYHACGTWVKFFILACMADPEYQRELNGALMRMPELVSKLAKFFLTGLWIYSRSVMSIALPFFLYHDRKDIASLAGTVKGSLIVQKKNRLIIKSHGDTETAFVHRLDSGSFKLAFYPGAIEQEPDWGHTRISHYDKEMRVSTRDEFKNGALVNKYAYDYAVMKSQRITKISKVKKSRIPLSRTGLAGLDKGAKVYYNRKGHIESGSYMSHGNLVRFKYRYRKNAKYDDELLRAEFVLPHMSVNVSWCAPPVRHAEKMERWIPTPRVHEATFVQGADVYECSWFYDHKFHPTITTKLNGCAVDTPDMIRHDWLGVLKKPTRCAFNDENPLLGFKAPTSNWTSRLFRTNIKQQEISTSKARSQLWKAWKKRNDLDGVVIRWVDEELIRKEPLLKAYWRRRDRGNLLKAEDYLALHADAITASSDLTSDISAWTPLAIRLSDLFSFGQGGDAVVFTRTKTLQSDTDRSLHVVAVDTGTWPNEGGGVSACRRDLINNLRTIRWHMVVESANDFGLPKHQTEENVESLKVIPLWGLDFMHPSHGMFTNKLDSEVDHLVKEATITDIKINFIPTLTALVRGARAIDMTAADVKQATRALVNLNTYFENSRHWKEVWTSDIVKDTWRRLWLADDMPNAQPPSEWFRTELPTLGHFDTALELWFRYLSFFPFQYPIRSRMFSRRLITASPRHTV